MPKEKLQQYNEIKNSIKPVTDFKSLSDKINQLKLLDQIAKEIEPLDIKAYLQVFENVDRYSKYRTIFVSNLYGLFESGKLGMSLEEFLGKTLNENKVNTILKRTSKEGIGVTPSDAEALFNNLSLLNQDALNEYSISFDKSFKMDIEKGDVLEEIKEAEIYKIKNDESLKEKFIADSGLSNDEAISLIEKVSQISTKNIEKYSQALDIKRVYIEGNTTKTNKKEFRQFIESGDENLKKAIVFESADDSNMFKGFEDEKYKNEILDKYSFKISGDVRNNILEVYNKMKEYNMLATEDAKEEQTKVYGFKDYDNLKREIIKTSDPKKLIELTKKFDESKEHYREVLKLCDKFDNVVYPGNVDVVRNNFIESEFSSQIAASSWLNSIYGMSSFLTKYNKNVEDFLDNPLKVMQDIVMEYKDEFVINKIKGKSCDVAYEMLNTKQMGTYQGYGIGRVLEFASLTCNNNEQKLNGRMANALFNGINDVANRFTGSSLFSTSRDKTGNEFKIRLGLIVEDSDNYPNIFDGIMDINSLMKHSYDPIKTINEKEFDVKDIANRINTMLKYDLKNNVRTGRNEDFYVEQYSNLAKAFDSKHFEGPEAITLKTLSNAKTLNDLNSFVNDLRSIEIKATLDLSNDIQIKDKDGNVISNEEASKLIASDKQVAAYKNDELIGFYDDASIINNEANLAYDISLLKNEDGSIDYEILQSDVNKMLKSIDEKIEAKELKKEEITRFNNFVNSALDHLDIKDDAIGYLLNSYKDANDYKKFVEANNTYKQNKETSIMLGVGLANKNVQLSYKDIAGKNLSFKEAVELASNGKEVATYNANTNEFLGISGKNIVIKPHNVEIKINSHSNKAWLDNIEQSLKAHNPLSMRLRNMFSSGPYSQMLDTINELKSKNLSSDIVMYAGLKKLEEKATNYYLGKLNDGKKATSLNEARKEAAHLLLIDLKSAITKFEAKHNGLDIDTINNIYKDSKKNVAVETYDALKNQKNNEVKNVVNENNGKQVEVDLENGDIRPIKQEKEVNNVVVDTHKSLLVERKTVLSFMTSLKQHLLFSNPKQLEKVRSLFDVSGNVTDPEENKKAIYFKAVQGTTIGNKLNKTRVKIHYLDTYKAMYDAYNKKVDANEEDKVFMGETLKDMRNFMETEGVLNAEIDLVHKGDIDYRAKIAYADCKEIIENVNDGIELTENSKPAFKDEKKFEEFYNVFATKETSQVTKLFKGGLTKETLDTLQSSDVTLFNKIGEPTSFVSLEEIDEEKVVEIVNEFEKAISSKQKEHESVLDELD